MRRMTRYARWQFIAFVVYFVLFFGAFINRFVIDDFSFSILMLVCVVPQLLFHLAVWRNWRGIVDEQIVREQDRAMAGGRSYLPGTAERRRRSLQRGSMWMMIMFGLVFSFLVVVVVLDVGGWLG